MDNKHLIDFIESEYAKGLADGLSHAKAHEVAIRKALYLISPENTDEDPYSMRKSIAAMIEAGGNSVR